MRRHRTWPHLALLPAFALAVMNGGCILIPEIKDRIVELAVGGSTVVEFVSSGTLNTLDETNTVNVLDGFNLAEILADNGIDVTNVTNIALSGVEYRVTVPDANPQRQIVNGSVTIDRDGSGPLALLSGFTANIGAASDWQTAPLDPGGAAVASINAMLNDIRTELPFSPPPSTTTITYHVTGDLTPSEISYNFTWEMKVKITITGTVTVSVPT